MTETKTTISRNALIAILTDNAVVRNVEYDLDGSGICLPTAGYETRKNITDAINTALGYAENLGEVGDALSNEFHAMFNYYDLTEYIGAGTSADNVTSSIVSGYADQDDCPDIMEALRRAIVDDATSCVVNTLRARVEDEFQEHFCTFEAYHIDITD